MRGQCLCRDKEFVIEKASLMSNAFIIVQEDSLCYDQIKATEMLAYFDSTGVLASSCPG